jgi:small multidrug resistance pump
MNYLYLAIAICAEVGATLSLKQSDGMSDSWWSTASLAGYAVAFYFLSLTLKSIPTGIAYAIWAGAGIILISLLAWLFQGQKLDTPAIVGIGLIVSGVAIMNLFSKAVVH